MKARYFASDFPKSTPTAHWDATFCNGTRTADVDVFKAKDAEEWHAFIHENGVLQENCLVYVYETKPSLEKIKADYMKKDFN